MVDLTGLGACQLTFSVTDIPASNFYMIEVANQKGLSHSLQDLKAKNWRIRLSLSSETLADGSSLAPATEKDKAARKLSAELETSLAKLKEIDERAERNYNIAMNMAMKCDAEWRLFTFNEKGKPMSKDCQERFIKEKGKTPDVARAEYFKSLDF
ncbi:MAG: hypothetical protein KME10_23555 [Plectolyngbya sp. WJT66-NPBG17]|jgi:hypothetical protein|nr:hypothetical protein [Plectolyngbya sp. WJT66-NPBG17]